MKFIMLINVKMPAIAGILTFISMINTASFDRWKKSLIFSVFVFISNCNFMLSRVENIFDEFCFIILINSLIWSIES